MTWKWWKTWNSPYGYWSRKLKTYLLSAGLLISSLVLAEALTQEDEDFLLFLADSIEQDQELIDPLSMLEQGVIEEGNTDKEDDNETNNTLQEANDEY